MSSKKRSAGTGRSKKRKTVAKKASRHRSTGEKRNAGEERSAASGPGNEPETGAPLSAETIYAFADELSEARQTGESQEPEERPESWVSFVLGEQDYALPVQTVFEILRVGHVTRVPHAPSAVIGVCNRRGRVLPVVDLRRRLGVEATATGAASRIVVVSSSGRLLGLLVDSMRQVEAVLRSQVLPPPESVADVAGGAVDGVVQQQGRTIILLDLASLLRLARPLGEKIA